MLIRLIAGRGTSYKGLLLFSAFVIDVAITSFSLEHVALACDPLLLSFML
jgi:hypothetical protein